MASNSLRARLRVALGSGAARDEIISLLGATPFGNVFYVAGSSSDMGASDTNDGLSSDRPLATPAQAMTNIAALNTRYRQNGIIFVTGDLRGAATIPADTYGWKIIGAQGGAEGGRHTTDSGTVLPGNGCAWREAATADDAPLLVLDEQGWELHNFLMIPQSGYAAVQLSSAETAADFDGSHAVFSDMWFLGPSASAGYGLEDDGGMNNIRVYNCQFRGLEFGWKQTSVGIRSPQWHRWIGNRFINNKHDITMNALACEFRRNSFRTVYHGTTHPNTLNLAYTSDAGVAATPNVVIDNEFADAAADVTIAKGYKPATGDVWRNRVSNTAADIVTVPT